MERQSTSEDWLIRTALCYLGTPYLWGGDDPEGFDCSGYVLECLKSAGVVRERDDFTAGQLMKRFSECTIDQPRRGALLFSVDTNGNATHVAICLDQHFQIGASGGDSTVSDRASAFRRNAYVKIRPIRFDPARHRVVYPMDG